MIDHKLLGVLAAALALALVPTACEQRDAEPYGEMEEVGSSAQELVHVPPLTDSVVTIAGTGIRGSADSATALTGTFNDPTAIAKAVDGSFLVTDWGNNSVRRIKPDGSLDTFLKGKPNLLVNPGCEVPPQAITGIYGWTGPGSERPQTQCPDGSCQFAYDGSRFFWGGPTISSTLTQLVDVTQYTTAINGGVQKFHFSGFVRASNASVDRARVKVEYLSSTAAVLSTFDSGELFTTAWSPVIDERVAPVLTRKIRVSLIGRATGGSSANAYFDSLQLRAMPIAGSPAADDRGLIGPKAIAVAGGVGSVVIGANGIFISNAGGTTVSKVVATGGYVPPARVNSVSISPDGYIVAADALTDRLHVKTPAGIWHYADLPGTAEVVGAVAGATREADGKAFIWTISRGSHRVNGYACALGTTNGQAVLCTVASIQTPLHPAVTLGGAAGFISDMDGVVGGERFTYPSVLSLGLTTPNNSRPDILISEEGNHAIRRNYTDFTRTVAGDGTRGFANGAASAARFNSPGGAAIAPDGSLLVADRMNNRIRKVICGAIDVCNEAQGTACGTGMPEPPEDGDACTTDTCYVLAIRHDAKPIGASCADGTVCNGTETCTAQGCVSSGALNEDDQDPCTIDSCDPVSGVRHQPRCGGGQICSAGSCYSACSSDLQCVPGAYCNQLGFCLDYGSECTADSQCAPGHVCTVGMGPSFGEILRSKKVCVDPICLTSARTSACGFPGAPCSCSNGVECATNSDCPGDGQEVCTRDVGARVGLPATADVCMPQSGTCGAINAPKGECSCTPLCEGLACGQNPDDDCGGTCMNYCTDGQCGCSNDSQCAVGSYCALGRGPAFGCASGSNVCLPLDCANMDPQMPGCGVNGASCGPCPTCQATCTGKQCGKDDCGRDCPVTAPGACNGDGRVLSARQSSDSHTADFPEPLPLALADEVGAVAGSLSVSARGSASYSIPIAVPPGRGGLAPALSLSYTGSKAEGLLGPGWKIDGFSAIARCPRTVALLGLARAVALDSLDGFCLDGQPLVLSGGAQNYGAQDSEYRTEVDTFAKVVLRGNVGTESAYKGPQYFQVYTKDGRTLLYGTPAANDTASLETHGVKRLWAIAKITDRAGNSIEFTYAEHRVAAADVGEQAKGNLDSGELRPDRISYGSEGDGDRTRWVKFEYEPRIDAQYHYVSGANGFSVNRLKSITAFAWGEPTRRYEVGYVSPEITRVREVVEADGEGVRRKVGTTFDYTGLEPYAESQDVTLELAAGDGITAVADFDADGYSDLVVRHSDGSYDVRTAARGLANPIALPWTNSLIAPRLVAQLNMDGGATLIDPSGKMFNLENDAFSVTTFVGAGGLTQAIVLDIDGDSQPDVVGCNNTPQVFAILRGTRGAFQGGTFEDRVLVNSANKCGRISAIDIDGDGAEEILQTGYAGAASRILNPVRGLDAWTLETELAGRGPTLAAGQAVTILDFNGDGLKDVLAVGFSATLSLWESTGRAFVQRTVEAPAGGVGLSPLSMQDSVVFDYNGDGRDDLVVGSGSGASAYTPVGRFGLLRLDTNVPIIKPFVGDIDGDGNPDLVGRNAAGGHIAFGGAARAGLLSAVTDGLGRRSEISYEAVTDLADRSVRTFDPSGCFHVQPNDNVCVSQVSPLVSSVTEKLVLGDEERQGQSFVYRYGRANRDALGRGFRGFADRGIYTIDDNDAVALESEIDSYYEDHVRAGATRRETVTSPTVSASSISVEQRRQTSTFYDVVTGTSLSGRPFAKLKELSHEVRDVAVDPAVVWSSNSVLTVDGDGNTTDVVSTGPGGSTTTHFDYHTRSVATGWKIGLIKDASVTSVARNETVKRVNHFEYYANGLLNTVEREVGDTYYYLKTRLVRDAFGNVKEVETTDAAGSVRKDVITFDASGDFPVKFTNAESQVSEVYFDAATGQLLVYSDPNFVVTRWAYDGFGRQIRTEGPNNGASVSYFAATAQVSPISATSLFGVFGSRVALDSGESSSTIYDAFGRPVSSNTEGFAGADVLQETEYDWANRVTAATLPHGQGVTYQGYMTYEYDAAGALSRSILPDGSIVEQFYASRAALKPEFASWIEDAKAQSVFVTVNPRLNLEAVASDYRGAPLASIEAASLTSLAGQHVSRFEYGPFGVPRQVKDQAGNITTVEPDRLGRMARFTDPDRGVESRTHSAWGEVIRVVDGLGTEVVEYDRLSRPKKLTKSLVTLAEWRYDEGGASANSIGKLTSASRLAQPSGTAKITTTMGYEPPTSEPLENAGLLSGVQRRLLDETGAERLLDTSLTYDSFGRADTISYPSAAPTVAGGSPTKFRLKHTYDSSSGALKKVADADDAAKVYWEMLTADQGMRIEKTKLGNGLLTEYKYYRLNDNVPACTGLGADMSCLPGQLRELQVGTATAPRSVMGLGYTFDDNGNTKTRSVLGSTDLDTYSYDEFDQLKSAVRKIGTVTQTSNYTYDALGNFKTKTGVGTYTYAGSGRPHAVNNIGTTTFKYDANGNQSERAGSLVAGSRQVFDYNDFDLPWRVTTGPVAGPTQVTTYEYDAFENRVAKRTPNESTLYAGDLYRRVATSGSVDHRYTIYAAGEAVAEVSRVETAGLSGAAEVLYLHTDHLGSLSIATDANKAVRLKRTFDPFGAEEPTISQKKVRNGFTGHEAQDELGIVNMRGRLYDPKIGQFLQADPIVQSLNPRALNRYAYVSNNPLSLVDPTGFIWSLNPSNWFRGSGGNGQNTGPVDTDGDGLPDKGGGGELGGGDMPVDLSGYLALEMGGTASGSVTGEGGIPTGGLDASGASSGPVGGAGSPPPGLSEAPVELPGMLSGGISGTRPSGPSSGPPSGGSSGPDSGGVNSSGAGRNPPGPNPGGGAGLGRGNFFGQDAGDRNSGASGQPASGDSSTRDQGNAGAYVVGGVVGGMFLWAAAVEAGVVVGAKELLRSVAVRLISKIPAPAIPAGMNTAAFGEFLGWGTGRRAAQAAIGRLSKAELMEAGVTKQMAQAWANFYRREAIRSGFKNESAIGRVQLMESIARILP